MDAGPGLCNIFTLEPVVHLKDLLFAMVDGALSDALQVARDGAGDTMANLASCLELLDAVDGAPLGELVAQITPYRSQLEYAFLTLVRQAFVQHCALQKSEQAAVDVELVDDDLDDMTSELVRDMLKRVCAHGSVRDGRYFEYHPIDKCVLVDQACREALHGLVLRHVRFVACAAPQGDADPTNGHDDPSPERRRAGEPPDAVASPPSRELIRAMRHLDTPSEVFPRDSASQVCSAAPTPRLRQAMARTVRPV